MKIRSWLSTCSSTICVATSSDDTEQPLPSPKHLLSGLSSSSETPSTISSSSSSYSTSSLQSNLSLQTLPSVPSLQNLSLQNLNLSVTHLPLASLRPPRPSHITSLAVHNHLLYAASANEINVFDTTTHTLVDTFNGNDSSSGSVKSIAFSGDKIITAHQDSKIRIWKLNSKRHHKLVNTLPTVNDRLRRFVRPKNHVRVRRHRKRLWIEHNDAVSGLAVHDNFMCSVSWDKSLKIWGLNCKFRCSESVNAHSDAINAVIVSADGTIYTGSADCRIKVWGVPFGERNHGLIATLVKHKSAVNALALNNDGSVLSSGACDRSILVWEREDSANHMVVTGALRGHSKAILCLINVSDLLFSGSADRTVRIWLRGHDGQYCCLTVLDGHLKPVKSLAAVSDGVDGAITMFSGSFDGQIKVWQVLVSSLASSPSSSGILKCNS